MLKSGITKIVKLLCVLRIADLPTIVALLAAAAAAGAGVFSFIFTPRDSVIFALLTLIVGHLFLASLSAREESHEAVQLLNTISRRVGHSATIVGEYSGLPPFEDRVQDIRELWVHGPTLQDFLAAHWRAIESLLERQIRVRLLFGDGSDHFVGMLINFFGTDERDAEDYQLAIDLNQRRVSKLLIKFPLAIEARLFNTFPAHNLLIINPGEVDEEIQVHLNLFGRHTGHSPLMILRHQEFPAECNAFRDEYESIWEIASPANGDPTKEDDSAPEPSHDADQNSPAATHEGEA